MSQSKITLYGMYRYFDNAGEDLFELLSLPEGVSKATLVSTILLNGGEYEVVYADPNFVHDSIAVWSDKWRHTIEKWLAVISSEYNPIHNYDRTEEETRTPDLTDTNGGTVTVEDSRSAFDSSGYQPTDKQVTTPANTITQTGTETWDRHAYGNIGVTTTQQMIQQEIDISEWSLYDSIARLFLGEYVIPIMV